MEEKIKNGENSGARRITKYKKNLTNASTVNTDSGQIFKQNVLNSGWARRHIAWMMKKHSLKQDMFLIGRHSCIKRWIAIEFSKNIQREYEYVNLTSDTTESDLKSRRELRKQKESLNVEWIDQSVVRAALKGKVLILEGIEKAERNVLPILNNLLENREMHLEDGRFIVHSERFDNISSTDNKEPIQKLKLVRCHPNFVVICIGIPSPPFPGNPLDPPLRSRFQARHVNRIPTETLNDVTLRSLTQVSVNQDLSQLPQKFLAKYFQLFLYYQSIYGLDDVDFAMNSKFGAELSRTVVFSSMLFPSELAFFSCAQLLYTFQDSNVLSLFHRMFPFSTGAGMLTRAVFPYVSNMLSLPNRRFFSLPTDNSYNFQTLSFTKDSLSTVATFKSSKGQTVEKRISVGDKIFVKDVGKPLSLKFSALISQIVQSFSVGQNVCVVGPTGEGKTFVSRLVSKVLGYSIVETLFIYEDMTIRDLLQRRTTNEVGESIWQNTCLIEAMLHGRLCVLDGIHRLSGGIIGGLVRLIQDKRIDLPDGSKFLPQEEYENLLSQGENKQSLSKNQVFPIHSSFRILALATPTTNRVKMRWFTNEVLQLFQFFVLDYEVNIESLLNILETKTNCPKDIATKLIAVRTELLKSGNNPKSALWVDTGDNIDYSLDGVLTSDNERYYINTSSLRVGLSLRHMIRCAQRTTYFLSRNFSEEEILSHLRDLLERSLMTEFLPIEERNIVLKIITNCGFKKRKIDTKVIKIERPTLDLESNKTAELRIGDVVASVKRPSEPALIPETLFFAIENQKRILRDMLLDYLTGDNILLMGNQGVGKNKLTDTLLYLLYREREYIQLHRDTTVQNLTVLPTLKDNRIIYEDSALVRSMIKGRVLVIDEFDKAPSEVVLILKQLIVDGEISLSDGRRFVRIENPMSSQVGFVKGLFTIHPDFKIFALANRPGFPFLGNNFYRDLGDAFAGFQVGNPDKVSEIELLRNYGHNVDFALIDALTDVFQDLRFAVEEGKLNYPYSTRELVNIIRHLSEFPNDPLEVVLENVFSFDIYDPSLRQELKKIFERNGVPFLEDIEYDEQLEKIEKQQKTVEQEEEEATSDDDDEEGNQGSGKGKGKGKGSGSGTGSGKGSGKGKGSGSGSGSGKGRGGGRGGSSRGKNEEKLDKSVQKPFKRVREKVAFKSLDEIKADAAKAIKKLEEEQSKVKLSESLKHITADDEAYYNTLYKSVESEIMQLRNILLNVEAKEKERVWLRNKMTGEIDENKITDLAIGEKNVFKRRGNKEQKNFVQKLPKKLVFLVDCSASMSVFAGDNRLDRLCASMVMIMEALVGLEHKYTYEIIGHSGETPALRLAPEALPNRVHRMGVIKRMVDHADSCESGDNTLTSSIAALRKMKEKPADDYFLFLFSDANLEGYGVEPRVLADVLTSDKEVNAFALFIAEPYSAEEIMSSMPRGRAHIILDTKQLPIVLKDIFSKAMTLNSKL